MQLSKQAQSFFAVALLCGCLLAGCDVSGDETNLCDGREGLFVQTDRESYQVGERATLTVENCTGDVISVDGGSSADYDLEKENDDTWEHADGRGGLYRVLQDVEQGEEREVIVPVEPKEDRVDVVAGTYRYELEIYDSRKDLLPEKQRRSNTFEIIA